MHSCSNSEVRRCRPLLGTFVEVTARGQDLAILSAAVDAAFTAVERVHRCMSVHEAESELSRLNADAAHGEVVVSDALFHVLERGMELARRSEGAFDFTVGSRLARWGFVPGRLKRDGDANWAQVSLLPGGRVRYAQPLSIDLGGIAKGFAVDVALEAMQSFGISSGRINAGGDLRVFGDRPEPVHLRHPQTAAPMPEPILLCNEALATSSPCFTQRRSRSGWVSHLIRPEQGKAVTGHTSVTVRAKECWVADALTKVVFNNPELAESLLPAYGGDAFVLTA